MKRVGVVIPACNLSDLTTRCVEAIHQHAGELCRIYYVDNGSKPEERDAVGRSLDADDAAFFLGENKGFTAAVNVGLDVARGHEFSMLLNNDAFVTPRTVQTLIQSLETHDKLAAVGPLTDGPGHQHYARGDRRQRFSEAIEAATIAEKDMALAMLAEPEELTPANMVAFFCTLFRKEALDDVGLMDPLFADGLGGDDDWCLEARKKGWTIGVCPAAFCSHMGKQSFRRLAIRRNVEPAYKKLRAKHGRTS